jgi:hypothetical protein
MGLGELWRAVCSKDASRLFMGKIHMQSLSSGHVRLQLSSSMLSKLDIVYNSVSELEIAFDHGHATESEEESSLFVSLRPLCSSFR